MVAKRMFATEDELRSSYQELGSMLKMAERYGVSKKLILVYLNKYGIDRNKPVGPSMSAEISRLHAEKKTAKEVSKELGLSVTYIRKLALALGLKFDDTYHTGKIRQNGYILKPRPEHEAADAKGYVREHRLVMETIIGRALLKDEVVHHKNGEKSDNRPENLELMKKGDHVSHHHKGRKRRVAQSLAIGDDIV